MPIVVIPTIPLNSVNSRGLIIADQSPDFLSCVCALSRLGAVVWLGEASPESEDDSPPRFLLTDPENLPTTDTVKVIKNNYNVFRRGIEDRPSAPEASSRMALLPAGSAIVTDASAHTAQSSVDGKFTVAAFAPSRAAWACATPN